MRWHGHTPCPSDITCRDGFRSLWGSFWHLQRLRSHLLRGGVPTKRLGLLDKYGVRGAEFSGFGCKLTQTGAVQPKCQNAHFP
jgi:hypothetical protein